MMNVWKWDLSPAKKTHALNTLIFQIAVAACVVALGNNTAYLVRIIFQIKKPQPSII
jgi:hypothetical protein